MKGISLFDDSFSETLTSTYSLIIQLSYFGFVYVIFDNYNNKFIGLKHIEFEKKSNDESLRKIINEIIVSEDLLCKHFKNIKIILNISKFTLIPAALFDSDKLKAIFSFNQNLSENEDVLYYRLPNYELYILFSINKNLKQIFSEWYSGIEFYHQSCPFIQHHLSVNKNNNETKVYIDVAVDCFDIMVIKSSDLLFYNTFNFVNEEDFAYFVMNTYDKLKLNPELVPAFLSGDIITGSANFQKLFQFIKNISFNKPSDHLNFSYRFNELPEHFFINLKNLIKCE